MSLALLLSLTLWGAALGVITGALGTGGGLIAIPFLVLAFHLDQKAAQGTALVMVSLSAGKSLWAYRKKGAVPLEPALILASAGGLTATVSALWALKLSSTALQLLYGTFLLVLAIFNWATKNRPAREQPLGAEWVWAPGLLGGWTLGMFGVGGAAIVVPLLRIFYGHTQLVGQGLGLAFAMPGILAGLFVYAHAGQVVWLPGILLALGGFAGAGYGVALARNTKEDRLTALFSLVLVAAGASVIWKALAG